jgi:hypothetical protein
MRKGNNEIDYHVLKKNSITGWNMISTKSLAMAGK